LDLRIHGELDEFVEVDPFVLKGGRRLLRNQLGCNLQDSARDCDGRIRL